MPGIDLNIKEDVIKSIKNNVHLFENGAVRANIFLSQHFETHIRIHIVNKHAPSGFAVVTIGSAEEKSHTTAHWAVPSA